jgi:hypothetical protein
MENIDYESKYKMYKKKYLDLKVKINQRTQTAGGIEYYLSLFNSNFNSDWILTGSEAIKQYLIFFKRTDLLTFEPNDADILYVSKDQIYSSTIDGFVRKQTQPEKSMTFSKGDKSFDVTTMKGPINYYEINGMKLMTPSDMLDNYEENLHFRKGKDEGKIEALKVIKNLVQTLDKKRLPVLVERPYKSRFEDSDDDKSPKKLQKLTF